MENSRLTELINTAVAFTEYCIPVIPIHTGIKKPIPNPSDNSWWIIDDPHNAQTIFRLADHNGGLINLAALLGSQKQSPVVAVGVDLYKPDGKDAAEKVKSLGVSTKGNVWAMKTGRGGITVFYAYSGPDLERQTAVKIKALDLMSNGYTLVPPSNTSKLPRNHGEPPGGPYTWLKGHSPFDIPFSDLEEAPVLLVSYWQSLRQPEIPTQPQADRPTNTILAEALGPGFAQGEHDNKLTALAAHLNGLGLPRHEAEAIMLAAARNCKPPWASGEGEVLKKLESAEKKFGIGKRNYSTNLDYPKREGQRVPDEEF